MSTLKGGWYNRPIRRPFFLSPAGSQVHTSSGLQLTGVAPSEHERRAFAV